MEAESRHRVREIFAEVIALPVNEQRAYLNSACGGDHLIQSEVESLLRAHSAAGAFLADPPNGSRGGSDRPASGLSDTHARRTADFTDQTGAVIGRYKLIRRLGFGGFGDVYLAEQERPLRREVALKIPKLGMDTREVLARFETERQALTMMDHPNVAKVFDAGATDRGRPYFVMEYVPGPPISQYCDATQLGIRDRLLLFVDVCHAVQHAHQMGIIHRDLKPGNILVTLKDAKPVPMVIDFGIAKAIAGKLTDEPFQTVVDRVMGTPDYMSPEQAQSGGQAADIRADVYALGVILYQLLTGTLPLGPQNLSHADPVTWAEVIRNVDPPRPSMRLRALESEPEVAVADPTWWAQARDHETAGQVEGAQPSAHGHGGHSTSSSDSAIAEIARHRDTDAKTLRRQLTGDLDWIVMKCIEKDRFRRYKSVDGLASDVKRYLAGEPVEAVPPSSAYRVKKFVRRHRGPVLAVAVIALLLIAGMAGTTWGILRAVAERQNAERVTEFMSQTLEGAGPSMALGRDATILREMMDRAAKRINDGELKETPEAELQLRLTVGWTYRELAAYDAAEDMLRPAVLLAQSVYGDQHVEVASAKQRYGHLLLDRGQPAAALEMTEAALEMRQRLLTGDHSDVAASLTSVANCLQTLGRATEALPMLEEALEIYQRISSGDDPRVATSLNNLAACLADQLGQPAAALPKFQAASAMHERLFPDDHPEVARGLNNVAYCLQSLGRAGEALPNYEAALAMRERLFKGDHPDVATSLNNVAACLTSLGRAAEALPKYENALFMRQRLSPGDHEHVALGLNNVASCLDSLGRTDEALSKFEAALEIWERLFEGDHPYVALGLNNVAGCLQLLGRAAEALPKHEAALAIRERVLPPDHISIRISQAKLGSVLVDLNRLDEAEPLLLECYAAMAERPDAPAKHKQRAIEALIRLYEARDSAEPGDKYDEKAKHWRGLLAAQETATQPSASQPLVAQSPRVGS